MNQHKDRLEALGVELDEILLPAAGTDMTRWSVVACDQYTSEPQYWKQADEYIGDAPSTLRLIFPEVWLDREAETEKTSRISAINHAMDDYTAKNLFDAHQGPILVERTTRAGHVRLGLMVALDLDRYDYRSGSQSLVRATEGTIVDRLPPRIRIREQAALEVPHVMVLVDDPGKSVIEPLYDAVMRDGTLHGHAGHDAVMRDGALQSPAMNGPAMHDMAVHDAEAESVYDFQLMENSGHLRGWKMKSEPLLKQMESALSHLADPMAFSVKYGIGSECGVLLFAVGDGNHSLATAKSCWEEARKTLTPAEQACHPARHALVEIVNLHDDGLLFEPIHRVLFGADPEQWLQAFSAWHLERGIRTRITSLDSGSAQASEFAFTTNHQGQAETGQTSETSVNGGFTAQPGTQEVVAVHPYGRVGLSWENPSCQLTVGSLQAFLDAWLEVHPESILDYVHGAEVVERLGAQPVNIGFILPPIGKEKLFPTVIRDGALPRKTFSMGESHEKRFYLECRRIRANP